MADIQDAGTTTLLLLEVKALRTVVEDVQTNHLHHIYGRLGSLEADGRWIVRLMWGATVIGLSVAAGVFTLVARGL